MGAQRDSDGLGRFTLTTAPSMRSWNRDYVDDRSRKRLRAMYVDAIEARMAQRGIPRATQPRHLVLTRGHADGPLPARELATLAAPLIIAAVTAGLILGTTTADGHVEFHNAEKPPVVGGWWEIWVDDLPF